MYNNNKDNNNNFFFLLVVVVCLVADNYGYKGIKTQKVGGIYTV